MKRIILSFVVLYIMMVLCGLTTAYASEETNFWDDFDAIDTQRWRTANSGDAKIATEEYDGRSVLAIRKGANAKYSAPSLELKETIGKPYTAVVSAKIEENTSNTSIKSFEYVYFNLTIGTEVYRLQWFYNTSEFQLQKAGTTVKTKKYAELDGYQKYGWNKYTFEVTEQWIKIHINDQEAISYQDEKLSPDKFRFGISTAVTWAKNVGVYIDNIAISRLSETNFFDDFDAIDTQRWQIANSGDGTISAGEYDGRSVLAIRKGNATKYSAPSLQLKGTTGKQYTATVTAKIEDNKSDTSKRSFEYVYFNLTAGKEVYRLQWFYNTSEFQLQKSGAVLKTKNYTKLDGYQKYGWNEYTFEVTEHWIKILVNGREVIYYQDENLESSDFKFGISAVTMYAKNTGVYIDNISIKGAPENVVMIDPSYSVQLSPNGKICLKGKVYAPFDRPMDQAMLIGALYSDNKLKSVSSATLELPRGARSGEYSMEFDTDDLWGEMQIRIMLWEDYASVTPIAQQVTGTGGYFIDNFELLPEAQKVYDINFDEKIQNLELMKDSYVAGGYRIERIQGNNMLKIFSGYAKSGTQRNFGVLFPEIYQAYVMDVTLRSRRFLSESASVILSYDNNDNYYAVSWTQEGFPSLHEKRPAQKFRLCQNSMNEMVSGNPEEIMGDDAPFISQSYRIFLFDKKILVYRKPDGKPIFNYTAKTPINSGKIGFGVSGSGSGNMEFYVDDLKIWRLGDDQ